MVSLLFDYCNFYIVFFIYLHSCSTVVNSAVLNGSLLSINDDFCRQFAVYLLEYCRSYINWTYRSVIFANLNK